MIHSQNVLVRRDCTAIGAPNYLQTGIFCLLGLCLSIGLFLKLVLLGRGCALFEEAEAEMPD